MQSDFVFASILAEQTRHYQLLCCLVEEGSYVSRASIVLIEACLYWAVWLHRMTLSIGISDTQKDQDEFGFRGIAAIRCEYYSGVEFRVKTVMITDVATPFEPPLLLLATPS